MDDLILKMTSELIKSLAHPIRIKLLKILSHGERCVCELVQKTGVEQSNLSQHLSLLKRQGIISSRKEGTRVMYSITNFAVLDLVKIAENILFEHIKNREEITKRIKIRHGHEQ